MGTSTTRFHLYRPDPVEDVDVDQDLNANWNRIDDPATGVASNTDLSLLDIHVDAVEDDLQDQLKAIRLSVYGDENGTTIPVAKMTKQGNQSIPHNATTRVIFSDSSAVIESIPGMCVPLTERIKIKVKGLYLVLFQYTFDGVIGDNMRGIIQVNSQIRASHKTTGLGGGAGSPESPAQCSFLGAFDVDDVIDCWVWQFTGAPQILTTDQPGTYFSVNYQGRLT